MSVKQLRVLAVVATDSTYEPQLLDGQRAWVGKCIFCNKKLVIADDGTPLGDATLEHMLSRNQGGTNDVENLALACSRCNREKGKRHDVKRGDARASEVVEDLRRRRRERWREPHEALAIRVARMFPAHDDT